MIIYKKPVRIRFYENTFTVVNPELLIEGVDTYQRFNYRLQIGRTARDRLEPPHTVAEIIYKNNRIIARYYNFRIEHTYN